MWWYIPIVLLLSLLPLPLLFRACVPPNTSRVFVLAAVGSVGLAVAFFCLWKWLDYPVLAYLDGITYGCLAVAAVSSLVGKRLGSKNHQG